MQDLKELLRLDPSPDSHLCHEDPSYKVYVLTDKYSEGKNFHKCKAIVNYDLPWNPIGASFDEVFLQSVVFKHKRLKEYADPENILREKLKKLESLFGQGDNSDINEDGRAFVSFVDMNKSVLGDHQLNKNNQIGALANDEDSDFLKVLNVIKTSHHILRAKTKRFLSTGQSVFVENQSTIVLEGIDEYLMALPSKSKTFQSVTWHTYQNDCLQQKNDIDVKNILCTGYRLVDKIHIDASAINYNMPNNPQSQKKLESINKHIKPYMQAKDLKRLWSQIHDLLVSDLPRQPLQYFDSLLTEIKSQDFTKQNPKKTQWYLEDLLKKLKKQQAYPLETKVMACSENVLTWIKKTA